jgi:transporter family protein
MNLGFLLALVAGFIWSIGNALDKVAVSRFIKNPIAVTLIFCVTSLALGLVALFFVPGVLSGVDWVYMVLFCLLYLIGTLLYFIALQFDEPSRIVPLFSLTILFLAILSAVFLGEVLTTGKYVGIMLVAAGSFVITARGNLISVFKSRSLALMSASSFIFAVGYVIMRKLLLSYSFWEVFSFQRIGIGLLGIPLLLFFLPTIKSIFKETKKKYFLISFSSETLNQIGALLFMMASAVWLVTLVETTVSVQYLFIFLWGLIISRVKPELFKEDLGGRIIFQKIVSIALIIFGIYLIS